MKKTILIGAVALLSACSQKAEEAPAPEVTDTVAEAPAPTPPGTYTVKMSDGTMGKTVINEDGTYVDSDDKGTEEKGAFANKEGKACFDPEGDKPEECWTLSPLAEDGTFTATKDSDQTVVTVTPPAASPAG
ncbi:MAG: membrane lipoprotein lipid attachment site-containing protein [Novosphingobium sp.]|nr:membrane lipoprotein lipid attachment site-containing protein [Novosphingobium sp.]